MGAVKVAVKSPIMPSVITKSTGLCLEGNIRSLKVA